MEGADTTEAVPQDEPMTGAESSPVTADQGVEGKDEKPGEDPSPSVQAPEKDQSEEVAGGGDGSSGDGGTGDGGSGGEDKVEEQAQGAEEETKEPAKEEPKRSIEREVGITEFAGKHEGFFGIIKQR